MSSAFRVTIQDAASTPSEGSSHLIQLDAGALGDAIELSPFDQANKGRAVPMTWFYQETLDVAKLLTSLKTVLASYPVFVGRYEPSRHEPSTFLATSSLPTMRFTAGRFLAAITASAVSPRARLASASATAADAASYEKMCNKLQQITRLHRLSAIGEPRSCQNLELNKNNPQLASLPSLPVADLVFDPSRGQRNGTRW